VSEPQTSGPTRVVLIVLDGMGIGALPDADRYGDAGSNTLGNVDRVVPLKIPVLRSLGLSRVAGLHAADQDPPPRGACGRMAEASPGKDSVTGHWELVGLVLDRPFPVFPHGFPDGVITEFERRIGRGTLGNRAASGTLVIEELGPEHLRTGHPIVYTSADSVFQIAAHEEVIPVAELYRFCAIAYELVTEGLGVGRVIARPFRGAPGHFERTPNRRDFALPPPSRTLLDRLVEAGHPVVGIGKVDDLFGGRGLSSAVHTMSDDEGVEAIASAMREVDRGLIFANLVDFDTVYGHRNDPVGYAANLERFDARLADLLGRLRAPDVLVVTADHGNDPTTPSTDHSREHVPVLMCGHQIRAGVDVGLRSTFADLGQTLAELFGLDPLQNGRSFLARVR
jgi:phosphopentomutase